jgi:tetratricopeptide (TPR) repeat protein/DNA-binding CsgD family transcriptional regulator
MTVSAQQHGDTLRDLREELSLLFETRSGNVFAKAQAYLSLAVNVSDNEGVIDILTKLGDHHTYQAAFENARVEFDRAWSLLRNSPLSQKVSAKLTAALHDAESHLSWDHARFEESRSHILEAIKLAPVFEDHLLESECLVHLAASSAMTGDLPGVVRACRTALEIYPTAELRSSLKQASARHAHLRRVYAQLHHMLGIAALNSGDFEAACDYLHEGLAVGSIDPYMPAYINTHLSQALIRKGDAAEALRASNIAIEAANGIGLKSVFIREAALARSEALMVLKEYSDAIQSIERVLEIPAPAGRANDSVLYAWLAIARVSLHPTDEVAISQARKDLAKAEELMPTSIEYAVSSNRSWIAEAKFLLGDAATAYQELRQSLREHQSFWSTKARHDMALLKVQMQAQHQELENKIELMKRRETEKELSATAMSLAMQTELLGNFRNDLRHIVREVDEPGLALKKIKDKLKALPCEQIDWMEFEKQFVEVHVDFKDGLIVKYPTLTKQEIKMCQFARLGLKTFEMARLLCLSERSIESHRYTLRKKLGISAKENLTEFLAVI